MGKTCFASPHWAVGISCWCLKWLGLWAKRKARQAKASSWGISHQPSSASGRSSAWGACAAPSQCREQLCAFRGAAQACSLAVPAPRVGCPSPLPLGVLISWSPMCAVRRSCGEGGEHGLCRGHAACLRCCRGEGAGRAARMPMHLGFMSFLFLFCFSLFCFLLQQSVIEQVSWDN